MKSNQHFDVLIIGAGQAGLATGYYLSKTKHSFAILDASPSIGDTWKNRYDSLVLFTPRSYSSLPGLPLGGEPEDFPTKDEIADYLKVYAKHWNLPVINNRQVVQLIKIDDGTFQAKTNQGIYSANQVVVSTGPFQRPFIPSFSSLLPEATIQLHSSEYKNSTQLQDGPILVVGGGNSGAQIAAELSQERKVYLSISHSMRFLPLRIGTLSIFSLFRTIGLLSASRNSLIGNWFRKQPDPVFGLELRKLIKDGLIQLRPRVNSYHYGSIIFEDNCSLSVPNIIWSTGFKPSYEWIEIHGVFDHNNLPLHNRGVSPIPGLFFVGLPWQHTRGSALLGGVGEDAAYVVSSISNKNGSK